ncbi:putative arsenite efflux transporter [Diaporthe ampelina]|uniref:Putative arsenite efflux transporter n=1 Tax=Diaporthe ampelina TaxID=1214573 RepID=A0A0G2HSF0_9PEZI|nr:putative arsenite efflux transporter [Diaporthe ampelina]
MSESAISLDVNDIKEWHSIVTLIVFVATNLAVLFPFDVPVYLPRLFVEGTSRLLRRLRVISPQDSQHGLEGYAMGNPKVFTRLLLPINFLTAPIIADLFLLAILAIGREEVAAGTIGAHHINPIDIMVFFITLAYIAISIDASGLIRYLAFKVLQWGGRAGHKLFFYLYTFFFALGSFIGNDPIILSGTPFLAYMTRVSSNIDHPRAWIHTQFAIANVASAILVSSNPTNLVLAGAFQIKFVEYTANMIVPVIFTAILLFPCLLYLVFRKDSLVPRAITMHELPEEHRARKPVNPNIPHARGNPEEQEDEDKKRLELEEILNPYLDKTSATVGAVIMAATLITVLVLNAVSASSGEHPVFWVTLPAAFVMFCWDVSFGWIHRAETRDIARQGREEAEAARAERLLREHEAGGMVTDHHRRLSSSQGTNSAALNPKKAASQDQDRGTDGAEIVPTAARADGINEKSDPYKNDAGIPQHGGVEPLSEKRSRAAVAPYEAHPRTVASASDGAHSWCQETFPTVTAVLSLLPFALVPFAFAMFVLVEALVTKGWVPVFAYGWDHWVNKTGVIGAIGGMGFLSVILCNFAGTNIGTTILLSRVIQAWAEIHNQNGIPISDRTFWATVYAMALGVNYGAFSTAFSASLAGMLWRDILARKNIKVRQLDFARVNFPIIAISMTIGSVILIGEVYIMRSDTRPYSLG